MRSNPITLLFRFRKVRWASFLMGLCLFLIACTSFPASSSQPSTVQSSISPIETSISTFNPSPITVFFTDPYNINSRNQKHSLEYRVIAALDQAQKSIDIAMYNLSLPSVADALLRAQKRGISIRLVMESDSMDGKIPQKLMDYKIPIQSDRQQALMHNKFIIIDRKEVWTGSLNLTSSGVYNDNNNMVQIRDEHVAQEYENEFDEMFLHGQFGVDSNQTSPHPVIKINSFLVKIYFSPEDTPLHYLLELVHSANKRIDILAYTFTHPALKDALLERARTGVEIRAVFETDQIKAAQNSQYSNLQKAGLDVRKDTLKGLMHEKVVIVDEKVVAFGSYNYTRNAEEHNDENLMIIYDPEIAHQFSQEFETIFSKSRP